jgi:hypothetical protein
MLLADLIADCRVGRGTIHWLVAFTNNRTCLGYGFVS